MSQNILVVDDDESIRQLLSKLLSVKGYKDVVSVGSGMDALQHLLHHTPDLILLDVDMPEMDGWLLCEILTKTDRWKNIPIVFQSALIGGDNIRRGIAAGAHAYLEKPYTADNVAEVLASVFDVPAAKVDEVPAKVGKAVQEMAEAAKHTFSLLFGSPAEVVQVVELDSSLDEQPFEFTGRIKAEGITDIEVSTGFVRNFAIDASRALTQLEPEDLDDPLIQDSLQEILNMMLGTAVRTIGKIFPVQLTVPFGALSAPIPFNQQAAHKFRLQLSIAGALVVLVFTVG